MSTKEHAENSLYTPIRDYAIIGNLRSAVLISKDASVDWAPAPFIHSPSVFASILDAKKGGYWAIKPIHPYTSEQEYITHTNVLKTSFFTKDYDFEVIDFIPVEPETPFVPAEENITFRIKRKVVCTRGACSFEVVFFPKFNYARGDTTLSKTKRGILAEQGERKGILISDREFSISDIEGARAQCALAERDSEFFVFRYNVGEVDEGKNISTHHEADLQKAKTYWREWAHRCELKKCRIPKKWHEEVIRSALVLKILFFEPIGTVAAAATTSLPEEIGGVRNWDYRFNWLRDSAFTFQALFRLGHIREADEYISFLMRVCKFSAEREGLENLQIMYGLTGEEELTEEILDHLEGYEQSAPVRIGNGAYNQKQWDIYGSVLDMVWQLHTLRGDAVSKENWPFLRKVANHVVKIWREPDEGLWEVREGSDHFVYSKVMCWVALDRALKLADAYGMDADRELWRGEREQLREEIFEKGFNKEMESFTQKFHSNELDASLLLLPAVGFIAGDDPKMISTLRAIERVLVDKETALVRRYLGRDGLPGEEGAFLIASFWLVDAYVYAGEREKAEALFEQLLQLKNHVGLYSEEMNPHTKAFLGNFPQAYTHIGLINTALLLDGGGGGFFERMREMFNLGSRK